MNGKRAQLVVVLGALMMVALAIGIVDAGNRGTICGNRLQVVKVHPQLQAVQPVLVPYQYQVGQQLREQALAERVAQLVLERLQQAQAAPAASRPDQPVPPQPGGPPAPQAADLAEAQQLVTQKCAGCHRHNGQDADGVDLRNLAALSELQGWEVFRLAYLGAMPKNAPPLDDDQVELLLRWNVHRAE